MRQWFRVLTSIVATIGLLASIPLPAASAPLGPGILLEVDTLVDSVASDGHCSLREAINSSNGFTSECGPGSAGADSIVFGVNGTIVLGSALPAVNGDLGIDGTGVTVAISGNNSFDILAVNAGKTLDLRSLTLANGLVALSNNGTTHVKQIVFANNANVGQESSVKNAPGQVLTVERSTFSSNGGDGVRYGGALRNQGQATITASTFTHNRATDVSKGIGGAILNWGTLSVTRSTFSRNAVSDRGGAIFGGDSADATTVSNSTFVRNDAFSGGALFSYNATGAFTVTNSTLVGNTATNGTAIGANGPTATLILRNSLVLGVPSDNSCVTSDSGSIVDGGHDLSWPDTSCPGLHLAPKGDGFLRRNGGPTKTVALLWNSPAIDRGDPTTCQIAPINDRDQRNGVRPVDGDHHGGAQCDSGAFEFGALIPAAPALRSAISVTGGAEKLTWRRARDALQYVVRVRMGASLVATRNTTTAVTVTIPLGNGSFTWTVQACNSHGCTTSSTGSFTR
jgi:CSLREA domain-containing protein